MLDILRALRALGVFCAIALSGAETVKAQADAPPPAEVMVLGVYHFTGGGQDYINPEVDDYLAPARQAEIEALTARLALFQPTRIVVELLPEREAAFNARYQAYRRGDHALTVNERQQIGMRLAAQLGHDRLYAADFSSGMDFNAIFEAAEQNNQSGHLGRLQSLQQVMEAEDVEMNRPEVSVTERLISVNTPEAVARHNVYLTLAQMGGPDAAVGADQMTAWWGRNLHIFAQISWIAEPGERVLVIYGAGHKHLLDQFIDESVEMTLVDPLNYLR